MGGPGAAGPAALSYPLLHTGIHMDIDNTQLGRMMANTTARERRRIVTFLREQGGGEAKVLELAARIEQNEHAGAAASVVSLPPEPAPAERVDLSAEVPDDGLPPARPQSDDADIGDYFARRAGPGAALGGLPRG